MDTAEYNHLTGQTHPRLTPKEGKMLKTLALLVFAAISAVVMFIATVRLMNGAHLAFTDSLFPHCGLILGRCDPELVKDATWTGLVLFASWGSFILSSLKVLCPRL